MPLAAYTPSFFAHPRNQEHPKRDFPVGNATPGHELAWTWYTYIFQFPLKRAHPLHELWLREGVEKVRFSAKEKWWSLVLIKIPYKNLLKITIFLRLESPSWVTVHLRLIVEEACIKAHTSIPQMHMVYAGLICSVTFQSEMINLGWSRS